MKKYDSYKDSGVEWIGDVPSHWESWKISHAFNRIGSGTTPESGNPIYHENGTINWLNTGDLNDGILDSCSKKITPKALDDYSSLKLFPTGSLVMAMYGATIGKTAILNFETTTNQACCVFCDSSIIDLKFLQYWFIGNKEQIINLAIGGGQPNISQNILKDIRVWCPDYSEQGSLTQFLDHKTTQIDQLIAKKEQFIQLLEEERVAVINQAVTKGLPAEERLKAGLDPNVSMKDSGIEWLGEIPAHWEVKKLKYVCSIISNKAKTKPNFVLALENIESWTGKIVGDPYSNSMEGEVQLFQEGDILFNKLRPYLAKVCLAKKEGGAIGELLVLRPYEIINSGFLFQRLRSEMIITIVDGSTYGTKMPRASWDKFISQLEIGVPPIDEQYLIEKYIIKNEIRISELALKTKQEIELLKEYKTALISEVVTGKVDVSTSSTQV